MNKLSPSILMVGVAPEITTSNGRPWPRRLSPNLLASLRDGSERIFRRIVVISTVALVMTGASATGQNVLVNGGFEMNPPPNLGNNIGWPIPPWVLGTSGQTSNVVKVDGVYNYGTNGPRLDADPATGAGGPQHYLDITDGQNDFYQPFTPQCSGEVDFGGFFSTRANSAGQASVKIVQGSQWTGSEPVIGTTNQIRLPGGNSANDPWTPVSFTVPVTAGTTYCFVVQMDNNMNFDEGFVKYRTQCGSTPTPTPTVTPAASATPSPTPPQGCAQVSDKDIRCEPGGGYSYTLSATNNTGSAVSQILLTPLAGSTFTLSQQLFNLPAPLQNGQSSALSLKIGNAKSGDKVCFFVTLMSKEGPCCTIQVCPTLPVCEKR